MRDLVTRIRRSGSGRAVTGLDIEPGGIRAASAAFGRDGALCVEHAVEAALEPGIIRDGEVVDAEALGAALKALFDGSPLDRRVRIGVANQRIVVRTLELPPISDPKQLDAAVRFQAVDEVPMPLDQAVLDYAPLGTVETPGGPRMQVLIVAARRDMVERLLGAVRLAGLRPEAIDLSAFAMVRALNARDAAPVLHLAVGGVVNLAIAQAGVCRFTRVVAGGLEAMAIDLAERHEVPVEEARRLLMAADMMLAAAPPQAEPGAVEAERPADPALRILEDGVRRIAAEVRNTLDFHLGNGEPADSVERVLLTGPAAAIRGFGDALAARLALPVEIAAPAGADGDAARFAVAAGLAVEEAPA